MKMGQFVGTVILLIGIVVVVREALILAAPYLKVILPLLTTWFFIRSYLSATNRPKLAFKGILFAFLSTLFFINFDDQAETERPVKTTSHADLSHRVAGQIGAVTQPSTNVNSNAEILAAPESIDPVRKQAVPSITDPIAGDVTNAATTAKRSNAPWKEKGWTKCLQTYKSQFKASGTPWLYRYYNGRCGELPDLVKELKDGECYMSIRGPGGIFDFKEFEISLHCPDYRSDDLTCSNAKNFYSGEIVRKMKDDLRCKDFPDLVSKRLKDPPPEEFTRAVERFERTGKYEDLPDSIKHSNHNTDKRCRRAVDEVRRLENHPNFDFDRSLRQEWQRKYELAVNGGCNL